jgi:cysteinyl-tRNA synthetase
MSLNKQILVYNSLSHEKEVFESLVPNAISFYVCGVTVYDYCHLGHARAYVAFDVIRRYLEYVGYDVTFVQNFTDIDDKIIARAAERNMTIQELTDMFISAFHEDMKTLNIKKANVYPKATKYVGKMIAMIRKLIEKDHAYVAENGDVCFSIESFKDYGKLSKKDIDDLVAGSRVDVREGKRSPMDFVLWKKAKEGEPSWKSPWGEGRPGWHIECSAMATDVLAETIDIHAGGADLIFPHHENEIAQSECATDKQFARYWLHNGFVTIKDEKMSKSLGNFFTIRDILESYSGEVVRFFLMKMHYRSGLNYTVEGLEEAKQALSRFHTTLRDIKVEAPNADVTSDFDALEEKFHNAMCDDFNYTEAIGVLYEVNKLVNVSGSGVGVLKRLGELLGLFFDVDYSVEIPEEVQQLLDQRNEAKATKNYEEADRIRDLIQQDYGFQIKDTAEGVKLLRL